MADGREHDPPPDRPAMTPTLTLLAVNQARAMRVAELMTDFRNIQVYMSAIRTNPSAEEYNEMGFVLLRRCVLEARALLAQPFNSQAAGTHHNPEEDKANLRRIIIDAAVRRFRAQKLYLRAVAALRWVQARGALQRGARSGPALAQIDQALRMEVATLTDQRVEMSLRAADQAVGKWLAEDPPLSVIQRYAGA